MKGLAKVYSMVENPMENSISLTENPLQSKRRAETPQATVKQCRICLQTDQQSSKQLISPCKCTGSVKFIHAQCLKSWIQKSLQTKKITDIGVGPQQIDCEMCKQSMRYNLELQRRVRTCQQFKKSATQKRLMFSAIMLMLIIIISLAIFIIWFAIERNLSFSAEKLAQSVIVIAAIVVIVFFFILSMYFLIDEFFLGYKICVEVIKPKQQSLKKIFSSSSDMPSIQVIIEQLE